MMKSNLLFFITIFISVTLCGQTLLDHGKNKHKKKSENGLICKRAASYKSVSNFNHFAKNLSSIQSTKQRLDSASREWYDYSVGSFIPDNKDIFIYDLNGVLLSITDCDWDENLNAWEMDDKEEYTFSEDGSISVIIESWWDDGLSDWISDYKEEFTYNAIGDIVSEIESELEDTIWVASWKIDYIYNGPNLEQVVYSYWDTDSIDWQAEWKDVYIYTGGVLMESYELYWDETYWREQTKHVYTHDSNQNIFEDHGYYWDSSNQVWDSGYKTEYGYDVNGNPVDEIFYYWNSTDSTMGLEYKYEYSYDLAYTLEDMLIPPLDYFIPDYNNLTQNMPLSCEYFHWQDSIWSLQEGTEYYYSEQEMVNISEETKTSFRVYPNPASNMINIASGNNMEENLFELFDMGGRSVFFKSFIESTSINVERIESGLYFFRISNSSERIQTGKVMVN